jgi:arylformamidase
MIYLSHYLNNDTPCYGGKNDIDISKKSDMCCGDTSNGLSINLSNHVGTHVDLPRHFDKSGKTLDQFEADYWFFNNVQIIEFKAIPNQLITFESLSASINSTTDALILKTGFEAYRDKEEYWNFNPGIHEDFALHLRQSYPNLRIIGFDFISVTSYQDRIHGRRSHRNLLSKEEIKSRPICVIEDMSLKNISETTRISQMIISPLLIDQADGIQVTVFAKID